MKHYSELICDIINDCNIENGQELLMAKSNKIHESIKLDKYDIVTDKQSKFYNKEKGKYRLLSINNPLELFDDDIGRIKKTLTNIFKDLFGKISIKDKILIVGLGNRHIVADSLGTSVCKKINITIENFDFPKVMAICPSVLGLTGIETYDIVKGVVDRVKPTHLILIDSLCAKDESRLARSIQVSTTGVCPGSGIGNNRKCLTSELAKHVYSIGVPLLIFASTFVDNNFDKFNINMPRIKSIMQNVENTSDNDCFLTFLDDLNKCIQSDFDDIIVSLKDIDECVKILSDIISSSLNDALGISELNTL